MGAIERNFDVLGGNRGRRHVAARVAAIVPLCLSWLSFSLRLSLFVSFPFTNLFLTLSISMFTQLLKCRTAGKRQTGITGSVAMGGAMTLKYRIIEIS